MAARDNHYFTHPMQILERAISVALAVSALAIAGGVVHRSFAPPKSAIDRRTPEFVPEWEKMKVAGIRSGSPNAAVTIVEFVDFECPACRVFHGETRELQTKFGDQISLVYLPYPLGMHRFANAAARAAECAAEAGQFDAWADAVFSKQDSLGLRSWGDYAADAGITDTSRIVNCAKASTPIKRFVDTRPLARLANVEGTPTVLINGWRYYQTPSQDELEEVIQGLVEGKRVFPRTWK